MGALQWGKTPDIRSPKVTQRGPPDNSMLLYVVRGWHQDVSQCFEFASKMSQDGLKPHPPGKPKISGARPQGARIITFISYFMGRALQLNDEVSN